MLNVGIQNLINFRNIFVFSLVLVLGFPVFAADESPQGVYFQGRLMDATGLNPLVDANTNLIVRILDHNQQCILYEEQYTGGSALNITDGTFAIKVGTGGQTTIAAPGGSMARVFGNEAVAITGLTGTGCGGSYTPAAGDIRYLELTVNGTVLTPNLAIYSVPQALSAETLNGLTPTDFAQITGSVTQAALEGLLDGSSATGLHTHTEYVQMTAGTQTVNSSFNISGTVGIGGAPAGKFQVTSGSATEITAIVKGAAGQSVDLMQWRNDADAVVARIDQNGNLYANGSNITGVVLADGTVPMTGTLTVSTANSASISSTSTVAAGKGVEGIGNNGYGVYGSSTNGYGTVGVSQLGFGGHFSTSGASTNPALVAQGGAGSTGAIFEARNSGAAPLFSVDSNGAVVQAGIAAPAVSTAGSGKIYFDSTANKFKVSENNGAYVDLVGGAAGSYVAKSGDTMTGLLTVTTGAGVGGVSVSAGTGAIGVAATSDTTGVSGTSAAGTGVSGSTTSGLGVVGSTATGTAAQFTASGATSQPLVSLQGGPAATGDLLRIENSGGTDLFVVDSTGSIVTAGISAPAVSAAGTGKIYFDSTANKFKVSENNGAYVDLVGGAAGSYVAKSGDTMTGTLTVTTGAGVGGLAVTAGTGAIAVAGTSDIGGVVGNSPAGTGILGSTTSGRGVVGSTATGMAAEFEATGASALPVVSLKGGPGATGDLLRIQNNGGTNLFVVDSTGSVVTAGISAPAVSAAGTGKIYFDSTANKFKVSENNGAYIDLVGGGGLPLDGSSAMTGAINMGTNKITNMGDPTNAQDAATKNYVDTNFINKDGSVAMTAALPVHTSGLVVSGDPNTTITAPSADTWAFTAGGNQMLTMSSSDFLVGTGDGTASPGSVTVRGPAAVGTDIAGGTLTFAAGQSTGNGLAGSIKFQTPDWSNTSGTTQQAMADRLTIGAGGLTTINSSNPVGALSLTSTTPIFNYGFKSEVTQNLTNGAIMGQCTGTSGTTCDGIVGQSNKGHSGKFVSGAASNTSPTLLVNNIAGQTADLLQVAGTQSNFRVLNTGNVTAKGFIQVNHGAAAIQTLQATLTAGVTASMAIANSSVFPDSGYVVVNNEIISYTGKTTGPDTLTGLTRGLFGTTDTTHLLTFSQVVPIATVISSGTNANPVIITSTGQIAVGGIGVYNSTSRREISAQATTGHALFGASAGAASKYLGVMVTYGAGVYGSATGGGAALAGVATDGYGIIAKSVNNSSGYFQNSAAGNTAPTLKVDVIGGQTSNLIEVTKPSGAAAFSVGPDGETKIGESGTAVKKILSGTATCDPPSMGTGNENARNEFCTVTVTGVATGGTYTCFASHSSITGSQIMITAHPSAANTVRVNIRNGGSSTIDPASGTVRATCMGF